MYAKFHQILNKKQYYLQLDDDDYYKEEVNNCLKDLENFNKVYDTVFLLSSFSEEVKMFSQRIYNHPQKLFIKTALATVSILTITI